MHSPAPLILLVGMHRSGTSLLGSLLPHLGVAMPGDLLPGDIHNPEGYFERSDVTKLQEDLLIELDRFWASSNGSKALPANWRSHPATKQCENDLRKILIRERSTQKSPWAIKDPRSSLFLPLWKDLCFELDIPLRLLLAVRNPDEVIASVMARDELLAGMTWWRAQQLWWRFNSAVLLFSRSFQELRPIIVHYDDWFKDCDLQAIRLASALNLQKPNNSQLRSIRDSIKPQYRHMHAFDNSRPKLDSRLVSLYKWFKDPLRSKYPGISLELGPISPRRSLRQQLAHLFDWIWLIRSSLLPKGGLLQYRKLFLQGEGTISLISLTWILKQHPSLSRNFRDPLAWYQRIGWKQGISPHPLIRPEMIWSYLSTREESVSLYLREGRKDDIPTHPLFDPVYYCSQCRDLGLVPNPNPLEHYLNEGWKKGLNPHLEVDSLWMHQQYGLPGEPLSTLIAQGSDINDRSLLHPCGHLYGACLDDPISKIRLSKALVDVLQVWNARDLWPAKNWLQNNALNQALPNFALLEQGDPSLFGLGMQPKIFNLKIAISSGNLINFGSESWQLENILSSLSQHLLQKDLNDKSNIYVLNNDLDKSFLEINPYQFSKEDWAVNLTWPKVNQFSKWIELLRALKLVIDPCHERTAFLQTFGVHAIHHPFTTPEIQSEDINSFLIKSQLEFGLPDPRWLKQPIKLVVVGSSSSEMERRWGLLSANPNICGLLLFPRLSEVEIEGKEQLLYLQAWFDQLTRVSQKLLLLKSIAGGACRPLGEADILGPEHELELILAWEKSCKV